MSSPHFLFYAYLHSSVEWPIVGHSNKKQSGRCSVSFRKICCHPKIFLQYSCLIVWNFLGEVALPDYSAEQIKLFPFFIPLTPVNAIVIAEPVNCFVLGVFQIFSLD